MNNVIQIKHGSGKPANGKLLANELGYDTTNGYLYIGNLNNETVGIKTAQSDKAIGIVDNKLTLTKLSFNKSVGTMWYNGRESNCINVPRADKVYGSDGNVIAGFLAGINIFTHYGSWSMGTLQNGEEEESLCFCYMSDEDYQFSKNNIAAGGGQRLTSVFKLPSTGIIPINYGGTGASTAANARTNLGLGTVATENTVPVSKGGTGLTTLTAGYALIGNGGSNVSLRAIQNITAVGHCNYGSGTATNLVNLNTLAYWNGRYNNSSSNLAYCTKGAFGTIVTKNAEDYLPSSGGTLTGNISTKNITISDGSITLDSGRYAVNSIAGINCNNSDIINANGIFFGDYASSAGEGLYFSRSSGTNWDALYSLDGDLRFYPNKNITQDHTEGTTKKGYSVYHSGNLDRLTKAEWIGKVTNWDNYSPKTNAVFTPTNGVKYNLYVFYINQNSKWDTILIPRTKTSVRYNRYLLGAYFDFTVSFNGATVTFELHEAPLGSNSSTNGETVELWGVIS